MTYPLEDIHITISVSRHLHHGLNVGTSIIMNKLCISIPAWDICIMEIAFASLSGSICIRNKKSRLASCFVCIHRRLTSRSVVKSMSIAYWGTMLHNALVKTHHGICIWHLHFAFVKTRKDKKEKRFQKMFGHFILAQSYIAWHIASDICFLIWNRDAERKRVLHSIKALERPSDERR